VIGGNVAECAGGPRAFKYGVTRQYVLGTEAVLASGEVIRTGGRVVKNVVGYDLTQLLVGSEGTLAILTEITLRLIPKPPAVETLRATFSSIRGAVDAALRIIRAGVVPASLELIDQDSLEAVAAYVGERLAPAATNALLLIEVDGLAEQVAAEGERVEAACRAAGATELLRATAAEERQTLWRVRREISPSLLGIRPRKINHDIVVPKGRIPELFDLVARLKSRYSLPIPAFGHVGDGNIHVNFMIDDTNMDEVRRADEAALELFRGVVLLGGAISGEHGIGFSKAPYLGLGVSPDTIEVMKRVKNAFDPLGILNPGKIFPDQGPRTKDQGPRTKDRGPND
jgi:glycolate oxidase